MSDIPRTLEPEVMDTVEEAEDYDSMDHAHVNRVFVDDLLTLVRSTDLEKVGSELSVVDLGTGTAQIPLELLSRNGLSSRVLACDLSLEMLRLSVRNLREHKAQNRILPTFCDAKSLPMADNSCDIVMSNSIVHHIPEPLTVFEEMRRVIRPDGILFVRDLMRPVNSEQVEELVAMYAGDENAHQQQMFRQSLHAALTLREVQGLLTDSGFPKEWVTATSDRHWTIAGRIRPAE